jgi:hypothetical protein
VRCGDWSNDVVPVQVIPLHEGDELGTVLRIRRVDAREGGRECIRVLPDSHSVPVIGTGRQEFAMIVEALRDVVVHPK